MAARVLITGATGTLGRQVVTAASAAGHQVRALSRRDRADDSAVHWWRGDLLAGTGIDEAVDGVDVIVNCATQPTGDKDVTSMQNLTSAARRAGVGHLVHVSIVGIDRIPLPYYQTKLRVEEALDGPGVGHTVLRATQFHDLISTIFSIQRYSPVLWALRDVRFQPIDTIEVASRLVELIDAASRRPGAGHRRPDGAHSRGVGTDISGSTRRPPQGRCRYRFRDVSLPASGRVPISHPRTPSAPSGLPTT